MVTVLFAVLVGWLVLSGFVELSLVSVGVCVGIVDGAGGDCVAARWRAR